MVRSENKPTQGTNKWSWQCNRSIVPDSISSTIRINAFVCSFHFRWMLRLGDTQSIKLSWVYPNREEDNNKELLQPFSRVFYFQKEWKHPCTMRLYRLHPHLHGMSTIIIHTIMQTAQTSTTPTYTSTLSWGTVQNTWDLCEVKIHSHLHLFTFGTTWPHELAIC